MEVLNLFDTATVDSIKQRLHSLTPQSTRLWGKMSVSQMLEHCKVAFKVPLSEKPYPRSIISYTIGPLFKGQLYNEKPYRQSLPTAPYFIIKDEPDFEAARQGLLQMIDEVYQKGPGRVGVHPHPIFGRMNAEQWGKSLWKHLDHHLRQFGA